MSESIIKRLSLQTGKRWRILNSKCVECESNLVSDGVNVLPTYCKYRICPEYLQAPEPDNKVYPITICEKCGSLLLTDAGKSYSVNCSNPEDCRAQNTVHNEFNG